MLDIILIIYSVIVFAVIIWFLIMAVMLYDKIFVRVPFVSTPAKTIGEIIEKLPLKKGDEVFDLGCGDGRFLFACEKKYQARATGYELGYWPYFLANFRGFFSRSKARIIFGNMFDADIKNADVVYCYLWQDVMDALEPKFKQEMKKGALVASYGFQFSSWKYDKAIELGSSPQKKLYIYSIK